VKAGAARLVTLSAPRSPAAEAYRTLRTNLQFSRVDKPLHTLLFTSPEAGEGKSLAVCNLAVTLAQGGTSVLVVDCDLRRPSIHRLFDLANDKGLATSLLSERGNELPLQATAVPNLRALPAGPPPSDPADLLGTRRMQEIIEDAAALADLVLFDSPPVGLVADAAVLSPRMDGVILVVSAGKTRRETAGRARAILEKANARILGVVLENARVDTRIYRYFDDRVEEA